MALLEITSVAGGYGEIEVVHDVSLQVPDGQLVTLLGANGAGKTTLVRIITGLLSARTGRVSFDGQDITRLPTHRRSALGLTLVPEGRELFPKMTVAENLEMGATSARARPHLGDNMDLVRSLFPVLVQRHTQLAGTMSGGEQQMLAIARGLMAQPRLLIIDELSLGLAPRLITQLMEVVDELKARGQSMLLTEQNVRDALAVSDYAYVLAEGGVSMEGPPTRISQTNEIRQAYLGL